MATAQSDLDRWKDEARKVQGSEISNLKVPFHVLTGEAVDVARFCITYWAAKKENGGVVRQGLETAAGPKSRLYAGIGDDILSLQRAAQEAQTQYLLVTDPASTGPTPERGRLLLNELMAVLEWHFDDGIEDDNDAKLARLNAAHADDPRSMDALASALDDYAALAEPHRADLDGLGGFEAALIDEARETAKALRERPAVAVQMSDAARQALTLRNEVATLLEQRMGIVRAAARFVFRGHPEIVRQVTSAYQRRQRAALRRAEAQAAAEAAANKAEEEAKKANQANEAKDDANKAAAKVTA